VVDEDAVKSDSADFNQLLAACSADMSFTSAQLLLSEPCGPTILHCSLSITLPCWLTHSTEQIANHMLVWSYKMFVRSIIRRYECVQVCRRDDGIYGVAQKLAHFGRPSSSNIYQFSNFFYCQHQEKICNSTITPHLVCRYITLWNISVFKAITENKTTSVTTHFKTASSSSKADALNIWCKNCSMR